MSSGGPQATISPPPSPPSGPRSITQSAVFITSRLCSITTTVLPRHQLVQHLQQLLDVVEMQARGRLVQDVERAPGGALRQFFCQLDALGFTAGERGRLLADVDVVEADAM